MYPVHSPFMTLDYGVKRDRYYKGYHTGIDLVSSINDNDIFAVRSGYVAIARASGTSEGSDPTGWGNYVIINYDGGSYCGIYAHLSGVLVKDGQYVNKGDKIGIMGFTGSVIPHNEQGKHLHYEVRIQPWDKCNDVNPHFMLNE